MQPWWTVRFLIRYWALPQIFLPPTAMSLRPVSSAFTPICRSAATMGVTKRENSIAAPSEPLFEPGESEEPDAPGAESVTKANCQPPRSR